MSNSDPPKSLEPQEQESVRTTIVGGRPPGSGKPIGDIPRGIEILLKKASVDPKFRKLLLENQKKAAEQIELELDDAELAMLQAAPKAQLAKIIDKTEVPDPVRRELISATTSIAIVAAFAAAGYFLGGHVIKWVTGKTKMTLGITPDDPTGTRYNVK